MTTQSDAPEFLTTREMAARLRVRERKIYEMAAAGEIPHRRLTGKLLFPRAEIDVWLAGGAPKAAPGATAAAVMAAAVVAGSHDPLLDWAIRESGSGLATRFDGSLDGLARLAAGEAVAAGLHVFEPESGDWNRAHAAEALGGAPVALIGWARRRQGLLLGPKAAGARCVGDLRGLRVARRQAAAGAGLLLAHLMGQAGLAEQDVVFTSELARTETDAAAAVAAGHADAAPGLEAMARQFGLGFAPLMEERFDLAVDRRAYFGPPMQRLLAFARGPAFAAKARALGGYDLAEHGAVRWNAG